jgi:hypothetical protein
MTWWNPRPSSPPRRLADGTRWSSNTSSVVSTPWYPIFSMFGGTVMPSNRSAPGSFSTYRRLMPLCGGSASGSVLHSSTTRPARSPFVTHIFWPVTTYSSPSRIARHRMAWTSEPAPGSDIDSAARRSPVAIRGSHRAFCSSVPCFVSRYTPMKWVLRTPDSDIQPRDSSLTTSAYDIRSMPAPPNSSGTVRPNSPISFIRSTTFSGNSSRCSSSSAIG